MINIVHLSTVHKYNDSRIVKKMCESLSKEKEFKVFLAIPEGDKNSNTGFEIITLKKYKYRFFRWIFGGPIGVFKAIKLKPNIVHIHDMELFPFVFLFKLFGIKVILDIHENYWISMKNKHYLPNSVKKIIQVIVKHLLNVCVNNSDYVVCAWKAITKELDPKLNQIVIENYPYYKPSKNRIKLTRNKINKFLFSGVLSFERGLREAIEICEQLSFENELELRLVGRFKSKKEQKYFESLNFEWISHNPWMGQEDLYTIMSQSDFGFILFHPIGNHMYSVPNKIFEHMSFGIVSIVNDLPVLNSLTSENNSGVVVNVKEKDNTITKLKDLISNNELIESIKKSALNSSTKYLWSNEFKKLLKVYKTLNR